MNPLWLLLIVPGALILGAIVFYVIMWLWLMMNWPDCEVDSN